MLGVKTWFISLHSLSFDLFWEYFSTCFCYYLFFPISFYVCFRRCSGVITTVKKTLHTVHYVHLSWNATRLFCWSFWQHHEPWKREEEKTNFCQWLCEKHNSCNRNFDHAFLRSRYRQNSMEHPNEFELSKKKKNRHWILWWWSRLRKKTNVTDYPRKLLGTINIDINMSNFGCSKRNY